MAYLNRRLRVKPGEVATLVVVEIRVQKAWLFIAYTYCYLINYLFNYAQLY
jgi:hypothetical protein